MPSFEETFSRNLGFNRADSKSMKLILDSHNVEVTEAIKEHVNVCVHKLEHMNQRAIEARVNLERDHVGLPENSTNAPCICILKGRICLRRIMRATCTQPLIW